MQNSFANAALLFSYAVFACGSYVSWPSRWNIVAHINLGLYLAACLIPLLYTDLVGFVRPSTVHLYTVIMIVGALAYLLGLALGLLFESCIS
jgi:hypothetical protein